VSADILSPPAAGQRPTWLDLALATVTTVGVLTGTVLAGGEVSYAGAVPLAAFLGLALLARRRWPLTVLLVSVQAVIAFRSSGLTEVGWVWPVSAAYFTVVAGERRAGLWWAVGVGLVELAFAASWDWAVVGGDPGRALAGVAAEGLWLAVVLAAAIASRNWYRWRAALAAGLRRLEYERELESRRRGAEERLRMAREVHDVVAHTLTVVGVQLRVVAEALDDSPAEAREALRSAQEVRAKAVADLRSLIGVLRGPGDQGSALAVPTPQLDLAALDDLLARARAGGLDVTLDTAGDMSGLPAPWRWPPPGSCRNR
jgi:signal transduction histidine kinase